MLRELPVVLAAIVVRSLGEGAERSRRLFFASYWPLVVEAKTERSEPS
ncbi:MAG: hypothetical protein WCL14_01045 [Bacteroidota bacterium]